MAKILTGLGHCYTPQPQFTTDLPSLIEYSLYPDAPQAQRFVVEMRFALPSDGQAQIRFATWTPGSYKIRDYARHVLATRGWIDGSAIALEKTDKSTWAVQGRAGSALRIQFELFGMDDSVRGAWLDRWRAHFEGAAIFPCVVGQETQALRLELRPPSGYEHWQAATALSAAGDTAQGWGWYTADNWRDLIDHPIMLGELEQIDYTTAGCEHRMVLAGAKELSYDAERLRRDCEAICATQSGLMGSNPNSRYLFQLRVAPSGDGGLEHCNSSLLASAGDNLPQSDADSNRGYERLLGLISHEYFHLWNVKRIRPQAVAESALDVEAPFPDLWAYEGVTAYLDDWFLRQSATRSCSDYLRVVAENLTRLEATPGRFRQSLSEASEDAWIRLYQPTPHLPLSTVSYYLKGALVAMALDLELRRHEEQPLSLIALLRQQYEQWQQDPAPLPPHALERLALQHRPDLEDFFVRYIHSTEEPDFAPLLADFGLRLERRAPSAHDDRGGPTNAAGWTANLGLRWTPLDNTRIGLVEPESPAEQVGVVAGDELLSVDRRKLGPRELDQYLRTAQAGQPVHLGWLHDGLQREAETVLAPAPTRCFVLRQDSSAGPEQRARGCQWLGLHDD